MNNFFLFLAVFIVGVVAFRYYFLPVLYEICALSAIKNQRFSKAFSLLDKLLRLSPKRAEAWSLHGSLNKRFGRTDNAVHDFNRAIALAPFKTEFFHDRALLFMELGQYEKALDDLNHLISVLPMPIHPMLTRSAVYIDQKEYAKAEADCDWILQHETHEVGAGAINNRGLARYHLGRVDEALADFELALLLDPQLFSAKIYCALCCLDKGDPKRSVDICDRLAIEKPENSLIFETRGKAWASLGQGEKSEIDFQKAALLSKGKKPGNSAD